MTDDTSGAVTPKGPAGRRALPAGDFSAWLRATRRAWATRAPASVPCQDCTACCTSSYFIHVGPKERRTLARIPRRLLFAAPGLPKGNLLLGYDEQGRCPMLIGGRCSIYEARPQTCRDFDCRVFAAAGVDAGGLDKALINERVLRWRFRFATQEARMAYRAVRRTATFLRERAACFPSGFVPSNPTQLALLAIKVHDAFIDEDAGSRRGREAPTIVKAVIERRRKFDARALSS